MNARELIESGLLESYCLGQLPIAQMREIESMACQHAEVREELQRIQQTLEAYVQLHRVEPPAHLKQRITARLSQATKPAAAVRPLHRQWSVAATVAALVISAIALMLWLQQSKLQKELTALRQSNEELARKSDALQQLALAQGEQLAILSDLHTRRVEMKGTPRSPASLAVVYWNPVTHTVFLDVKNLPATPADRQYQLWFITPDQKPVDAGVFHADARLLRMKDAQQAVAFAVTVEPVGGSPQPTLEQMVVVGQVPG